MKFTVKYAAGRPVDKRDIDLAFKYAKGPSEDNPGGDFVVIEDGEHETTGCWNKEGYTLTQQGVILENRGVLRMSPNPDPRANGKVRVDRDLWFQFGRNTKLYGGTYDLNEKAFLSPSWSPNPWYACGIRFPDGGACDVDDVDIIGLRGRPKDSTFGGPTATNGVEAFALSMGGKPGDIERDEFGKPVLTGGAYKPVGFAWSRVRVHDVAPDSYVSGVFPGGKVLADAGVKVDINDCVVDLGKGNWFEFSASIETTDQSVIPVTFRRCTGRGAQRGFHNDTGNTFARIENSKFEFEWAGISLYDGDTSSVRVVLIVASDLIGDCGVDLQGPGMNTVILCGTKFTGERFGSSLAPNGRIIVIDPITDPAKTPKFQTFPNGTPIRSLDDRRMVLS